MKGINFMPLLLGAAFIVSSCGKGAESTPDPTPNTKPVAARLSSTISKAVDTNWSTNDKIGVFMLSGDNVGSSTILDGADNIAYKVASAGANGVFSPVTASEAIMLPEDGSNVTFAAYYPHSVLTNYVLNVNLTNQSNQEAIDIMSAKTSGINKNRPDVAFTFTRAMSKIVVNISSDIYTPEQMAGVTAKITTLNTTGTFSLADMTLSSLGNVADITLKTTTAGAIYEAIVFPSATVAAGGAKLLFAIDGNVLEYKIETAQFVDGGRYTYTLKLGRASVTNINSTITDWVDDPTINNGTAE